MDLPEEAAAIAATQHGVISHRQLREAGVSPSTMSRWVGAGRLVRLWRGLYALGHRALTRDGWWHAAALVGAGGNPLTARAGCEVWLLLPASHGPIDVVPRGRIGMPPPWVRPLRTPLAAHEITTRRGLPVATVPRAIVDLADRGTPHEVGTALDAALLMRLVDRRELDDAVARAHGRPGLRILRPAMELLTSHGETFLSKTERDVRNALLAVGLPRPRANQRILRRGLRPLRPDLLWPDARLVVEIDGPQHQMPYQQELDRQRDQWLTGAGYRVIRFPVEQVDHRFDTIITRLIEELRP